MSIQTGHIRQSIFARLAVAAMFALGLAAPAAWAHGHDHGRDCHHHHHYGYMMKPHNAAMHLLMMAHAIGLSHEQVEKLMKMRNDYIKHNAVAEDMLEVDHKDLNWLLYAGDFDKEAVNKKLDEIGKLRDQLWTAYVNQRAEISTLLTQKQKDKIKEMYHHRKMGMGHERGDHDMGPHGDMGEHRGHRGMSGDGMSGDMDD